MIVRNCGNTAGWFFQLCPPVCFFRPVSPEPAAQSTAQEEVNSFSLRCAKRIGILESFCKTREVQRVLPEAQRSSSPALPVFAIPAGVSRSSHVDGPPDRERGILCEEFFPTDAHVLEHVFVLFFEHTADSFSYTRLCIYSGRCLQNQPPSLPRKKR